MSCPARCLLELLELRSVREEGWEGRRVECRRPLGEEETRAGLADRFHDPFRGAPVQVTVTADVAQDLTLFGFIVGKIPIILRITSNGVARHVYSSCSKFKN